MFAIFLTAKVAVQQDIRPICKSDANFVLGHPVEFKIASTRALESLKELKKA